MDNLTGSMKDVAFATSPREFDLSYSTTLEEIMEKLNARRAAFQMPFQIKGGIELLHDLFQCGGIGKIKFTGAGRECDIFHAASKVIHSFLLSKVRWVADTYCASMRFIFS